MIKILAILPSLTDSCSFYRGVGVLSKLRQLNDKIEINYANYTDGITYDKLVNTDIVFIQRPHDKNFKKAFEMIKENNVKIWLDYDDLFSDIPEHNSYVSFETDEDHLSVRQYKISIRKKEIKEGWFECLKFGDIITVSTKHLENVVKEINSNCYIIPNAFNDYIFDINQRKINKRFNIAWRGSNTHKVDLYKHIKPIFEAYKTIDCKFNFLGYNPKFITDVMHMIRLNLQPAIDPIKYMHYLTTLDANNFMVPLEKSAFNDAKSNIAAIEAAWSGASAIVPNMQEWQGFSRIYKNLDEFQQMLILPPTNQEIENDWQYVLDKLLLSKINNKRIEIIERVMSNEHIEYIR